MMSMNHTTGKAHARQDSGAEDCHFLRNGKQAYFFSMALLISEHQNFSPVNILVFQFTQLLDAFL